MDSLKPVARYSTGNKETVKPYPEDATHEIHGFFFKIGKHGFVYRWHSAKREWQNNHRKSLPGINKLRK